ncbi:minor tail protein [Mycobacterium phage Steamy]|uniref:Minor tail protein n=1 Tax=Mycobacterium phage Steamy TaxID=2250309 RepID=A0A345L0I2_9CAUD|nr:tail fiber protein [Mycobacterium phage Steamy]AXH48784.1 minor tail protein [Mycobacterium phage Steamy]
MKLRSIPPEGKPALSYVKTRSGSILGRIERPVGKVIAIPGIAGPRGAQGDTGPRGLQGDPGPQGVQGIQGPKGDTGPRGLQGDQGVQGPKGDQGDQGVQGPRGVQGPQGTAGTSLDIEGTVATYADLPVKPPAGSAYVVAADGRLYFFDGTAYPANGAGVPFQGPRGQQGVQGNQGLQGPKGDQGPQGIQGPKGDTGAAGSQGPQGIQGVQGPKGDTGPAGVNSWGAIPDKPKLVYGSLNGTPVDLALWVGTEAQYQALPTKNTSTVYVRI